MPDTLGAGGIRIFKAPAAFDAGVNVPGVLMPYQASWLNLTLGAQVCITKNGVPLITGVASGPGIDVSPGDEVSNGDLKFAAALAENDLLLIHYQATRLGSS